MEEGAEPTVPTGQEAIGPTSPGKTDPAPLRASAVPSKAETTRVLLVDDHAMMRQGLRSVLEAYADVEIVGEAGDGEEALASVERLRPSVVIMDINMPKMNGIDATKRIKQRYPETLVLGLSVNAGPENQSAMAQAGAAALLTKEAAVDQLYSMIQQMLPQKDR
jgi:DNA-binding NarL/FixJ family response regulator